MVLIVDTETHGEVEILQVTRGAAGFYSVHCTVSSHGRGRGLHDMRSYSGFGESIEEALTNLVETIDGDER